VLSETMINKERRAGSIRPAILAFLRSLKRTIICIWERDDEGRIGDIKNAGLVERT